MRLKGWVYIIGNDELGMYKIGMTRGKIEQRLASLQTGSPVLLKIIARMAVNYARSVERSLHQQFEHKRAHGEWFKITREDIRHIAINDERTEAWDITPRR